MGMPGMKTLSHSPPAQRERFLLRRASLESWEFSFTEVFCNRNEIRLVANCFPAHEYTVRERLDDTYHCTGVPCWAGIPVLAPASASATSVPRSTATISVTALRPPVSISRSGPSPTISGTRARPSASVARSATEKKHSERQ